MNTLVISVAIIYNTIAISNTEIYTGAGGPTFIALTSAVNALLEPLDEFADEMSALIDRDPVETADDVAADAALLWNYLNYGAHIAPGLLSLALLITLFIAILLVKVIMSLARYIKQLVAQWL